MSFRFRKPRVLSLAVLLSIFAVGVLLYKNHNTPSPATAVAAQVDYYLKIPGVEGETTRNGREGQIEIASWSWGAMNQDNTDPSATSRRSTQNINDLSDISFEKIMDKSSPKLLEALATGKVHEEIVLSGVKESEHGDFEFLEIKMKPVYITSYQTGGSSGMVPVDNFSLNFEKVEYTYKEQGSDGKEKSKVEYKWDIKKNQKI